MTTHLLVHYHTQTYDISLPDDVPLHALIPAIAHKLNLPTQQEDGAFDLFYLVYQEQILPFDQTLAQLQLPDKAEVLLEQTAVNDPTLLTNQTDFSELDAHLHRRRDRATNRHHEELPEWVIEMIFAIVLTLLLLFFSFVAL